MTNGPVHLPRQEDLAPAAPVLPAGATSRAFEAFVSAPDAATRAEALVALVHAVRPEDGGWKGGPLAGLLAAIEGAGGDRERFGAAVAAVLAETDATNLVACAGIPGHRGFFSEFGDRLANHLLPSPADERDLRGLVHRLYRTEAAVRTFGGLPLDLFHRVAAAFRDAPPDGAWDGLRSAFADGFRLLLSRVEAEGLSPKVRARASAGPVAASPFHRIRAAGDALLSAWLGGGDAADAGARFRRVSGECRKEARVIQQHLEGAGVSIDIVFSLEVIDRCLTRTALMTEIMEAPAGPRRSRAVHRLLFRLFLTAHEDRSLRHLVSWNLQLLNRKIVDRSGETGEHYIARNLREYRHIWLAAAGGGVLTVGTAVVKSIIHGWHLPALPEGLLYGLNYAVSFLGLQHLGLILATKQPAMTAARLAGIMRESEGEDREDRIAETAAQLTSSQLAAATGNVLVVAAGAALFSWLFLIVLGRPFMHEEEALETLRVMSPIDSMTIWYAALTGVVLWLASVAGGWFDNWVVYHRLADGLSHRPAKTERGRRLLAKAGHALSRHASGWGTNVSLGLMLGMVPEIGRFTGLPADVRHVTLNTGIVSLAASAGVETGADQLAWLIRAMAGIGVMFVLNLSVSFACSLFSAARAYELPPDDVRGILKGIGKRLVRRPQEFVRPPRGGPDGER
jgi:site-specific recombinase